MVSLVAHQRSKSDAEKLIALVESPNVKEKLPLLFSLIDGRKQQISIDVGKFSPPQITVECGDVVIWVNENAKSHTITSGNGPNDLKLGKSFDSGKDKSKKLKGMGKIFLHTFMDPGKYDYFCQLHQEETGRIIVRK
jgi:plastocyanin